MLDILRKAWEGVGPFYREERINSERCLQAVLYHLILSQNLTPEYKILVEPAFCQSKPDSSEFKPDLVICRNSGIKAIIEIKCHPHWWMDKSSLIDIDKLLYYSQAEKPVLLDIFGPQNVFDPYHRPELKYGKQEFFIKLDTYYCFAVLTKHNDWSNFDKIAAERPEVRNINFCYMAGIMDPNASEPADQCKFSVEPRGGALEPSPSSLE
jgi:hypothetical protein